MIHKEEAGHEECIWSCVWGRNVIEIETEKSEEEPTEEGELSSQDIDKPKETRIENLIVTGGVDDVVKVWVLKNNQLTPKHALQGHSLGVVSVDISKDGNIIASSSLDSTLCLHETSSGTLKQKIALGPVDLWTVAISPDNKHVISGSHEGKISMYSIETGKVEQVLDPQNGKFALSIAYSPDGKYIASGSIDGIIYIFDVTAGKITQTLEGHAMPIRSLCFSPDSQMLLTASDDGHSKLYDVTHSHSDVMGTMSGHASWVLSVSFSGDGQRFASSSSDKTVKVWDVAERKCLHTFTDHTDKVWAVAFSPDSDQLLSVSEDRCINLYDCPSNVV